MFSRSCTRLFVIGCGRLGASFASIASERGYSVTVLDSQDQSFRKLSPAFSGWSITGDGSDLPTLEEHGIRDCGHIFVLTEDDATNLLIGQLLRVEVPQSKILIRLYDPRLRCLLSGQEIETLCPVELGLELLTQALKNA